MESVDEILGVMKEFADSPFSYPWGERGKAFRLANAVEDILKTNPLWKERVLSAAMDITRDSTNTDAREMAFLLIDWIAHTSPRLAEETIENLQSDLDNSDDRSVQLRALWAIDTIGSTPAYAPSAIRSLAPLVRKGDWEISLRAQGAILDAMCNVIEDLDTRRQPLRQQLYASLRDVFDAEKEQVRWYQISARNAYGRIESIWNERWAANRGPVPV